MSDPPTLITFLNRCNKEQLCRIVELVRLPEGASVEATRETLKVYFRSHPEEVFRIPGMENVRVFGPSVSTVPASFQFRDPTTVPVGAAGGGTPREGTPSGKARIDPELEVFDPLSSPLGSTDEQQPQPPPPKSEEEQARRQRVLQLQQEEQIHQQRLDQLRLEELEQQERLDYLRQEELNRQQHVVGVQQPAFPMAALESILRNLQLQNEENMRNALDSVTDRHHALMQPLMKCLPPDASAGQSSTSAPRPQSQVGAFLKEARSRGLFFKGRERESLPVFLQKLHVLLDLHHLKESERLTVLGDLLQDAAASWYRVHRDQFKTWASAVTALKEVYIPADHQLQLRVVLYTRYQAEAEKAVHYIASMRSLNADLVKPLEDRELIEVLQSHLHPSISSLVGRKPYADIEEFERTCREAELLLQQQKTYQPPSVEMLEDPLYGDPEALRRQKRVRINSMEKPKTEKPPRSPTPPRKNFTSKNNYSTTCAGCNSSSHKTAECPTTARPFCFACGAPGITAPNCLCRQLRENGRENAGKSGN